MVEWILVEEKKQNLWNRLPKKTKLILIGSGIGLLFNVIFIVVLISPLISLGIIDIGSSDGSSSGSLAYANYSSVKDSTSYWWPIGGTEAVTSNGNTFTAGEPEIGRAHV